MPVSTSASKWKPLKQAGPGYYDEAGTRINTEKLENEEQVLARRYIRKSDTVLELGARYGTVSCIINKKLGDKTKQVSVEPDARVWPALERNRAAHNCEFGIVKGFVSGAKLGLTNTDKYMNGYAATAVADDSSDIPSYSLADIKAQYGIPRFSALVADCEGFLEQFFDENPEMYEELRLVLFERDYSDKCNYAKVEAALTAHGFKEEKWEDIPGRPTSLRFLKYRFQNAWVKPTAAPKAGGGKTPKTRRHIRHIHPHISKNPTIDIRLTTFS
jgi:FkbM family methyltransferase